MKNEVHVRTINSQYDKRRDTYDTNLALTVISLTFLLFLDKFVAICLLRYWLVTKNLYFYQNEYIR